MRIKSTLIFGIIACLACLINPAFAKDTNIKADKTLSTAQVLRETYGAN